MCFRHAFIAAAFLLVSCVPYATAADRPNVLFIAVDDLNDWIGCMSGHPDCKTPNIDRLADRSVLFMRAYCAAPACNPSRAALLTGVRPSTSGVYLNSQPWRPAMPQAVTLPQFFRDHGYRVVGGGKIFHGGFNDQRAWDEYFKQRGDPVPPQRPVNGIPKTAHFDWGPLDVADDEMSDHRVVDWAIDELGKSHDKPLFLACGIYRPHLPWYVPRSYFDQHPVDAFQLPIVRDDDLLDVPPAGVKMARPGGDHKRVIESDNWRKAVQGYLASVAFADAQVGRLMSALEESAYAENTIVVLWGDHGWHLGEKHHWRKFSLWEEATRVPLMVATPGMEIGSRSLRTVNLLDLYPTLADLCGLPIGDHLEGTSLTPLLDDANAEWDRPALTTHGRGNHSVRSERWRYIRYADGSEELYDHENDPMEWHNLAAEEQHASVKTELAAWLPRVDAPNAKSQPRRQQSKKKRSP